MLILSRADVEADLLVATSWGSEEAIRYRGQFYTLRRIFINFQEAVLTCRRDLEAGIFSIVVREDETVKVWTRVLEEGSAPQPLREFPRSRPLQRLAS